MERRKIRKSEIESGLLGCVKVLMIYYLVNQGIAILGLSALSSLMENGKITSGYQLYLETGVKMAAMFLGALSVFSYYQKENESEKIKATIPKEEPFSVGMVLLLVSSGALIALALNYTFFILGFIHSSENYQQVAEKQFSLPLWLAVLFYGVLSPFAEEIVFRGILYRNLKRNTRHVVAILGSAFVFGAFHGNIVQMVYGIIMGVIMALVYERFHNLLAPFLFHGAANVAVYVVSLLF